MQRHPSLRMPRRQRSRNPYRQKCDGLAWGDPGATRTFSRSTPTTSTFAARTPGFWVGFVGKSTALALAFVDLKAAAVVAGFDVVGTVLDHLRDRQRQPDPYALLFGVSS